MHSLLFSCLSFNSLTQSFTTSFSFMAADYAEAPAEPHRTSTDSQANARTHGNTNHQHAHEDSHECSNLHCRGSTCDLSKQWKDQCVLHWALQQNITEMYMRIRFLVMHVIHIKGAVPTPSNLCKRGFMKGGVEGFQF